MRTPSRTLVIETATEACSIALFEGEEMIARNHDELGRGHAERLLPMIEALPDKGKAQRILVSLGPGSFTGVRIGIAAARALGLAWDAEVLGYPTLALVAAGASQLHSSDVTVCMNGGHGEWFVQNFASDGTHDSVESLSPEAAKAKCRYGVIAGNRAQQLADLLDEDKTVIELLPDAQRVQWIAPAVFTRDLSLIYGRGPDAKPIAARAAS